MTDNEKRAHDIAICLLNVQMSDLWITSKADAAAKAGIKYLPINVDDLYMEAYQSALSFIEKAFPVD